MGDTDPKADVLRALATTLSAKVRALLRMPSDPREVYELVASQGARRVRACILGVRAMWSSPPCKPAR